MRAKTLIQLLSLSTSLYTISKDEELMGKISNFTKKGKDKLNDLYDDFTEDDEHTLTEKIMQKAIEAKAELDKKIEETAIKVYDKLHIAHTNEITNLQVQLEALKKELVRAEARIVSLETAENN
jgi:polyhydroxyalkanoate synthesis regulator phasin